MRAPAGSDAPPPCSPQVARAFPAPRRSPIATAAPCVVSSTMSDHHRRPASFTPHRAWCVTPSPTTETSSCAKARCVCWTRNATSSRPMPRSRVAAACAASTATAPSRTPTRSCVSVSWTPSRRGSVRDAWLQCSLFRSHRSLRSLRSRRSHLSPPFRRCCCCDRRVWGRSTQLQLQLRPPVPMPFPGSRTLNSTSLKTSSTGSSTSERLHTSSYKLSQVNSGGAATPPHPPFNGSQQGERLRKAAPPITSYNHIQLHTTSYNPPDT